MCGVQFVEKVSMYLTDKVIPGMELREDIMSLVSAVSGRDIVSRR